MVTFNMTGVKLENVGALYSGSDKEVKAYVACADCGARFVAPSLQSPRCECGNNSRFAHLSLSTSTPEWFLK